MLFLVLSSFTANNSAAKEAQSANKSALADTQDKNFDVARTLFNDYCAHKNPDRARLLAKAANSKIAGLFFVFQC